MAPSGEVTPTTWFEWFKAVEPIVIPISVSALTLVMWMRDEIRSLKQWKKETMEPEVTKLWAAIAELHRPWNRHEE